MKGKSKKLKKRSNTASIASDVQEAGAFVTFPAPQTATTSLDPNGSSSVPKPGFERISISAAGRNSLTSQDDTPVPGNRTKVAFGFATKRKADGDLMETPPPKR
jgi:U4/U6.U5 tri-snRNP-associated protein 1